MILRKTPSLPVRSGITASNDLAQDEYIFTGRDGYECEEWIRSIQKEAFMQGRSTDKAWTAALASSRIAGPALRWYWQLSEEITNDWIQLRTTLLDRYPASSSPERGAAPAYVVLAVVLLVRHDH